MINSLKTLVDQKFSFIALCYRILRDIFYYQTLKPYQTQYGFSLIGDEDLDTSRTASHEVATFIKYLEHTDYVVDIGANVGFFSFLAAQQKKPVLSIEPQPLILGCFCEIFNLMMQTKLRSFQLHSVPHQVFSLCMVGDKAQVC